MRTATDPRPLFRFEFAVCPLCRGRGTVAADRFVPSGVLEVDEQCRRCWGTTGSVSYLQQTAPALVPARK